MYKMKFKSVIFIVILTIFPMAKTIESNKIQITLMDLKDKEIKILNHLTDIHQPPNLKQI